MKTIKYSTKMGVTMAEILTVLVIIAILSGLLMSIISSAKSKAKETVCISNLRQIYTAVSLYQSDLGEYPPNSLAFPGLKPYYRTLLHCPASREDLSGEYDYKLVASGPVGSKYQDKLDRCIAIVGTNIPIILDTNHLFRTNPSDQYTVLFARENGAVVSKVFKNVASRVHGPCEALGLPYFFDY